MLRALNISNTSISLLISFIIILETIQLINAKFNSHKFSNKINQIKYEKTNDIFNVECDDEKSLSITFPGTRWCGPGNTANDYDDLGKFKETDKCCRDHDHCDNIPAGEEKYGLKNDNWFTRLHCDCDKKFFECLHSVNTTESDFIGRKYFLFATKCYKEDYPIDGCKTYQKRIFIQRCIEYDLDTSQNKKYQWFDLPLYDIQEYPRDIGNSEAFYKAQHECVLI